MDWKVIAEEIGQSAQTREELFVPLFQDGFLKLGDDGRIWKCKKWCCKWRSGLLYLKPIEPRCCEYMTPSGYYGIDMRVLGRTVKGLSHRVIWTLRNGPIPSEMQINHKDLDKTNNRALNLEIVTPKGNMQHWLRTAHPVRASESCCHAKLKRSDIPVIRSLHAQGMNFVEIARLYWMDSHAIGDICRYKAWRHV